ncbi:ferritin-like domain-containing protein [Vreelandella andesensis]|uniref:Ferritin-like domain-containing protein n=1 Tax=Vreelandella andesensis TaxID=447567 RepID=A0A3S1DKZ5_9GAMM|nr:ferritin-like domain-containing protein [Halomonas andesensis]RUR28907.1 ferritin-like domain-containing protein [Halomonas andesensis]
MDTEHLEDWLRDAHAMEKQAEKMLKAQAGRLEHYPRLQQRIEQHVTETQQQAKKLEHCLTILGAEASAIKDMGGQLSAFGQAVGGMMAEDEVVKGGLASYAFEHFEIASYQAIITASEMASQPEITHMCKEILQEEMAMADWLGQNLSDTTREYLERDNQDLRAKT